MEKYTLPPTEGSLLLAWQIKDKRVLIVGGGDVASGRIGSVLAAGGYITLISPNEGLHPKTRFFLDNSDRIFYIDRLFSGPEDLKNVDMVLTAIDDAEASKRICVMCRERRIPVNVADDPPNCDFYFGSQIQKGPLQILISTNGRSPKLANVLKNRIEESLPLNVNQAINNVGSLRKKLRVLAPGIGGELGKRRMQWMSSICTTWPMNDLAQLNETTMENMLTEGWEKGIVPKPPHPGRSIFNGVSSVFVVGFCTGAATSLIVFLGQKYLFTSFLHAR